MNSRQRRKEKRKIKRLQNKLISLCYKDFYKNFPARITIDIEELKKEIERQLGYPPVF